MLEATYPTYSWIEDNTTLRVVKVESRGYDCGQLLISPTMNCQLNSYRGFNNVLDNLVDFDEFKKMYDSYKEGRDLLVIDIQNRYVEAAINFFKQDRVVFQQDYKSTNGSPMSILLINMSINV